MLDEAAEVAGARRPSCVQLASDFVIRATSREPRRGDLITEMLKQVNVP